DSTLVERHRLPGIPRRSAADEPCRKRKVRGGRYHFEVSAHRTIVPLQNDAALLDGLNGAFIPIPALALRFRLSLTPSFQLGVRHQGSFLTALAVSRLAATSKRAVPKPLKCSAWQFRWIAIYAPNGYWNKLDPHLLKRARPLSSFPS